MVSSAQPVFFGDLLVWALGATLLFGLTLMALSALFSSKWVRRLTWRRLYLRRNLISQRARVRALGFLRKLRIKAVTTPMRQFRSRTARKGRADVVATLQNPYSNLSGSRPAPKVDAPVRQIVAISTPGNVGIRPVFGLSGGPQFNGRLEDVLGLYLSPPEHALVWSCKGAPMAILGAAESSVPARELPRSAPLSDALSQLYNCVIGSCAPRERPAEWLKFLRQLHKQAAPDRQLHVICDNPATIQHPNVQKWLAAHPRINIHFASRSASGLKMVKRFFDEAIAEQFAIGATRSVPELTAAIASHLKLDMLNSRPFVWVASGNTLSQQAAAAKARTGTKKMGVKQIEALNLGLDASVIRKMFTASSR